ncbi:5-methyltetrahydropteroyltriglutamate--homocysteine S-methyltransferase [Microbacterium thalassium]|uniref:5-methyltetrahydropteroyltriglutamate--homocysteine methyltransferase n=1 Tax=Microbacterium thalassium TaxID=362649 RepID=A0A7X0FPB4_9MICO|nr:5-methyltetrahydropteroyltriglutamate--homocysteine S-methyltransferase [Microbacterium thalassium]MBB6390611.1 5-methyltetrahydropteroyltriglutamate--homocysteine methyltransferase [Microbacterium thalassium]GLK25721.1 5-methyltetrahydropteroyltriglutamate--homocysteine S-methyltransferase [Microbacterium thalassium]
MSHEPPFRADIVGSFLRPAAVHEARHDHALGDLSTQALHAVEDDAIIDLVKKEADAGLKLATDGEFRRSWWHFDFFGLLDGVEIVELDHGIQFQGVQTKPRGLQISKKVGFSDDHPFLSHFRFLRDTLARTTGAMPKFSIPAPTVLDFRLEPGHLAAPYEHRDDIVDDLVQAYRDAVQAFYDAGCRYLQFDDTAWAYLCSDVELEKARARGIETDGIAERYSGMLNRILEGKPDDLKITTHVCRGNFRSTWISSGGYEPVAEALLDHTNYDGYFLEYDSERAGGFEPLRFLPEGDKTVVLGLITSKSGELEDVDAIKKRIDEASAFASLDQLALSPQCGFASTEEGNTLTEDEQWAKIREVVAIADDVWK